MSADSPTDDVPGPHGSQAIVTAGAPRGATETVVLALHGRGATAQGIVNLLDPISRHGVTFVAPDAHRSRWYPYASSQPIERNEPHFSSALGVVEVLLEHVVETFGVDRDHVVLTGFSQGACVAAEFAARNPGRYGAVAVLSGTLLGPAIDSGGYAGTLDETPVLVASGDEDPHVSADRARETADTFRSLDATVTERRYEGVGHEVTDDEFDCLGSLLDEMADDQ
ncbi:MULTISPECIES: alpha/beta hydrolase [Halomicrobium]|uniref:Phospholipase/Carboxylesterase n=2 Tax=Halomicrobium mukohataei TaxID=57705 RepID=C7P398_HALMD|nr:MULTISPECIES: dienelactone hydrolase family protein [Halomicrobium]ACV47570.1 phospholipase/Carboxylesterase [Halomicrobium mukohataei DSM 12286]QCD66033.1 phospholipase [Halomicrobium mukohataei]QFR20838.1 phospholipase [Halomicrobium sp. ZPS1]